MDGFVYGAVCGLGLRRRRGRLLLHGRLRWAARRRAAGVLRPCGGERPLLARAVYGARRDGHRLLRLPALQRRRFAGAWSSSPACRRPPSSATSCGTRRCSTCSPLSRGRCDLFMVPVATAVKGLPLLVFVDARGGPRAPARTEMAARCPRRRGRWAGYLGGRARDPRGAAQAPGGGARDMRTRAGAAPPACSRRLQREQVEPRHGPLEGRRERRPGARRPTGVLPFAPRRARARSPARRRPTPAPLPTRGPRDG